MPLSLGTRFGDDDATACRGDGGTAGLRSLLVASSLVVLVLLASPAVAQVVEGSPAEQIVAGDAGVASSLSLQRIRHALAVTPSAGFLNVNEYVYVIGEAPEEESLFGDFDVFNGPVPFGAPTRYDMFGWLTRPMGSPYGGNVDAMVFALFRRVGTAFVGLFTDEEEEPAPVVPLLLSNVEREQALAQMQGHPTVLAATIEQRGRTVALALVVPPSTPVETARELGDDFLRMVRTLVPATPVPGGDIRPGDYDYIIGVRTPTETELAVGGRPTTSPRITWDRSHPGLAAHGPES